MRTEPFTVDLPDRALTDLRARLRATRWPDPAPGPAWSQGTDLDYLRELVEYWADGFDWRAAERAINQYPQLRADVGGDTVHLVHARATGNTPAIPLLLGHGWPSAFIEYLPLVPLLTDPTAHGIDGPAFDVVIPSLPGYGWSPRPAHTGVTYRYVARRWHELMRGLGYDRYAVGGGDFGGGAATQLGLLEPDALFGLHLTNLDFAPYTGPGSAPLSEAEREYVAVIDRWNAVERGYSAIQSTKPQTVGYGLTDSPAGLAAWLAEKWWSWTDGRHPVSRDFLLTLLTVYWATRTAAPSMRDYYDNRVHAHPIGPADRVRVPTAIAVCPNQTVPEGLPPREWVERLYAVHRYAVLPRGGHFAPVEQPELVARDIVAFFADLPT